jgi:hypothetical protein
MKNLKLGVAIALTSALGFSSCIEHEVIPAPVPMVDLNCHFYGVINGTPLELTENVLGYTGIADKNLILLPSPSYSSAVYTFEMLSSQSAKSAKVSLGSVFWDRGVSTDPTETQFDTFHNNNLTPAFSNGGANGFEFMYRDETGTEWFSKENSMNFQDVVFSAVSQESDTSGHYSMFTCNFDCYVYRLNAVTLAWDDSMQVQNAVLTGWFRK